MRWGAGTSDEQGGGAGQCGGCGEVLAHRVVLPDRVAVEIHFRGVTGSARTAEAQDRDKLSESLVNVDVWDFSAE
ncbi:hypothetical protein GCM10017774_67970 [Lentzea cavernae]|uniref:Uncharacterized protein n=1 Tax=Lentzea cavernae TaxID=2020703 RepID=A0ABQ3MMM1_9PSEU|nr:hypothetical protein GCM10017774_67970 [Lentzea cavernae]